ncbi:MAG: lipid A biosynthesis acyltransferase [Proteobacteria bacterium]|nr:lipid A biosynthesis acyltransferase [Pseudomonadota bacterium]
MTHTQWKQNKEHGTLFWMRIIIWLARHTSRGFALILLHPISFYFLLTASESRKASLDFLGRTLARPVGWRDFYHHVYVFSTTLLDRVFLFTGRVDEFDVEVSGAEEILAYLQQGQGCLLLGSHLGSFEIMRAMGTQRQPVEFGLRILMHVDESEKLPLLLNELAPEMAEIIIPTEKPDTMLRVKEALDSGCLVALLADRVCGHEKHMACDFLGDRAHFPMAPAQLALALKVPVFSFYGIYAGGKHYRIQFNLLAEAADIRREQRNAWMEMLTRKYADELAEKATESPFNWFNFYDFWKHAEDKENAENQ